jgi:hypothetical protein
VEENPEQRHSAVNSEAGALDGQVLDGHRLPGEVLVRTAPLKLPPVVDLHGDARQPGRSSAARTVFFDDCP